MTPQSPHTLARFTDSSDHNSYTPVEPRMGAGLLGIAEWERQHDEIAWNALEVASQNVYVACITLDTSEGEG